MDTTIASGGRIMRQILLRLKAHRSFNNTAVRHTFTEESYRQARKVFVKAYMEVNNVIK